MTKPIRRPGPKVPSKNWSQNKYNTDARANTIVKRAMSKVKK